MMEKGHHHRKKSANGRKKRTTYEDLKKKVKGELCEFVAVPTNLLGFVIGKKGTTIKKIQTQSGARIVTHEQPEGEHVGFNVHGTAEEVQRAIELINEKVAEMHKTRNRRHASPAAGQLVKIPSQFNKAVRGPGGDNLRSVSTVTGAEVTPGAGHRLYVTGANKNVQHAEYLLRSRVASTRIMRCNRILVYIDDRYLPAGCELKLAPVEGNKRMMLPGAQSQYRLKPVDGYEIQSQVASQLMYKANYDAGLKKNALSALRQIKEEIDSRNYHKADMWCHFGTVIVHDPDEADVEDTWSIREAAKKLHASPTKKQEWQVAFKEGVDLDDTMIQDAFGQQVQQEFMARYDLSFLTPRSQSIRCKVWVANKQVKKKLEEIPIPFSDLKNVVEELRFEDESTRARCRGWLVFQSQKILQANIIFPGSNIDCRISIRALTEDAFVKANGVYEREATNLLSEYLSKLTFTDADGLVLPEEDLPEGYLFNHMRCSHRTLFTPRPGLSVIVSKERTWISDANEEETRETTDIHLHSDEWDRALSGEDWEPEMIVAKLPEFLQLVRDVQNFISDSDKDKQASPKK